MKQLTLCIDFNGVINSYRHGWQESGSIPDPPTAGALFALLGYAREFRVVIVSAALPAHLPEMNAWLEHWSERALGPDLSKELMEKVSWCSEYIPCHLYIGDRAMQFKGMFPSIQEIRAFRPWNRT